MIDATHTFDVDGTTSGAVNFGAVKFEVEAADTTILIIDESDLVDNSEQAVSRRALREFKDRVKYHPAMRRRRK